MTGHVRKGALYVTGCRSERNVPWDEQRTWVRSFIEGAKLQDAKAYVAVDATGMGDSFAEGLEKEFGSAIIRVNFSSSTQRDKIYSSFRRRFAEKTVCPDESLTGMRLATLSVRRVMPKGGGGFRIELPPRADGHADEAVGLALACYATNKAGVGKVELRTGKRRRTFLAPRLAH